MENVYSHNAEDWTEEFDVAVEYAKDACLYDHERPIVYVGDKVEITHKSLSCNLGALVIEHMKDLAADEVGEHADFYLNDLDSNKLNQLSNIIGGWFDMNANQPAFYAVKNIQEYQRDQEG